MPFTYYEKGEPHTWSTHAFGSGDLEQLDDFLHHKRVIPLRDVANKLGGLNSVAMRHDVDHSLEQALKFALWEYERGYRSSYYLLHTRWYYRDDDLVAEFIRAVTSMGHEVGIHNDAYSQAVRNGAKGQDVVPLARDILLQNVYWLRNFTAIDGAADHGGESPNARLWDHYRPEDLGLLYEAYRLKNHSVTRPTFISDNGGKWRAPLYHEEGTQLHMLVHPCHWDLG